MDTWASLLYTLVANYALSVAAIIYILRRRKEPAAMMAWILIVILLPIVGILLFLLIGESRIQRHVKKRRRRRSKIEPNLARQLDDLAPLQVTRSPRTLDPRLRDLVRVATATGQHPPLWGNEVTIYVEAERTFLALSLAIQAARHHVHMEYYIFQPDETGRAIRDLLIEKVRQGVCCRLLLDAVGSWSLKRGFVRTLTDGGVKVEFFMPPRLNARLLRLNCRNHRKLVVIDGKVGFTGSQNIGDEYLGRKSKLGPWRDTHLRLAGPIAEHLQEVFVEDWHFATGEDLSQEEALFPPIKEAGPSPVQIVASGPDRPVSSLHLILMAAVAAARKSINIMTPYFVPDESMVLALQAASLRGVQVQLLLPRQSDNWFVLWAGRSYYEELLHAGVEIYEYTGGMMHSKVVVVDNAWSMVGSANMDVRSFRLNFELTAMLYDERVAHELTEDFAALKERSRRIEPAAPQHWSFGQSMAVGLARLASPLL
ncbi:MAG: cardiolipin synthase [Phycisphaerae bacterium]|nr:cardiolipin synthase [Phycisphaerae bacterium]NUQ47898.1 cardiolipin synthase [Phycisphaerae bacterium]